MASVCQFRNGLENHGIFLLRVADLCTETSLRDSSGLESELTNLERSKHLLESEPRDASIDEVFPVF